MGRLAEKCASENPNVRGVINSVHLYGSKFILQDQLFLQPRIGEEIVFLNGISGMVEQVIINPSNRLVIGMILRGQFTDQLQALTSLKDGKSQPTERLIVIPMDLVRYLTKVSGFLHIKTSERDKYTDFNPADFTTPDKGWVPPYPYCPDHVFFPLQQQVEDIQHVHEPDPFQFAETVEAASLRNDFFANNSPGI